jgi:hypothetical protein
LIGRRRASGDGLEFGGGPSIDPVSIVRRRTKEKKLMTKDARKES